VVDASGFAADASASTTSFIPTPLPALEEGTTAEEMSKFS
jgi:hypothetical protein